MYSYYIKERNMNMAYIELRLLTQIECQLKVQKITDIITFLNNHGFINCLTVLNTDIYAEDIIEQDNIMSLTIDVKNDRMRFKFWDGLSTMWLFHTQDLFDILSTGREKFSELYDKYEPLTEIILNCKLRWNTFIDNISYQYNSDDYAEVVYHIVFYDEETKMYAKILDDINSSINVLGSEYIDSLNFKITHSFKKVGCIPCEKAKKEREKNENK